MLGNALAEASTTKASSFNPTELVVIVIIVLVIYMLMIRPSQRRRQQAQQQKATVQPGARVRTTAGMYATVVDVDGDDVILEVAPGIECRYMSRAIMDVVSPAEPDMDEASGDVDEDQADGTDDVEVYSDTEPEADDAEESAYEQATGTKKD